MQAVIVVVLCSLLPAAVVAEQRSISLRIEVRADGEPVADADVVVRGVTHRTDGTGAVMIPSAPGAVEITVVKEGFLPAATSVQVTSDSQQRVIVELQAQPTIEEHVTVVAATRTNRRLEDQPMRVEVLEREEIEEKMLMTPGDIVMMLNEMGGMRVQATSPSLGAASVRIQGMRGRYTRVLSDGLPLFGDVGGLGLLQIPPMDLGQVEVIKGVASALYGAGAMGGIINLLSRRPEGKAEREFLLNRSTRGATDAVTYVSAPLAGGWSASLLGGGHWQNTTDVNGDGWADLPGYTRGVVRPRFFWDGGSGRTVFATTGFTYENRTGGTLDGTSLAATGQPYVEALDTERFDAGVVGQFLVEDRYVVTTRAAVTRQSHTHLFGDVRERDRHDTVFGEMAVRGARGPHTWVAGLAFERHGYTPRDVPQFAYRFIVPGAFVQYDVDVSSTLSLSSSGRIDVHSEYGTFFSPRVSALARAGQWTSRLSVGTGFYGPTPITEETEAAGLTRLTIEEPLEAERGLSASFDLSRTAGPLSSTVTVFASRIADAVYVDRADAYVLRNLGDPTTNAGVELLTTLRQAPFALTTSYTYVRAREVVDGSRQDVPLTPRHSAGVVGMWEEEDAGRVGVEWYYTGRQALEENPYRATSEPYSVLGLLAERQFGHLRLFVNLENLTGVRQTRWDPLLGPTRATDGRWTVDAWAPLEGRNINGGVRLRF
ncbi:MAG TPA: TonB-dependent receptor plug domain-containing protein [Vicinamibacterales bacterium]|nr:TonB-dependent receptor plug domain-containing protein [Vicinamibacterales bacterium]